MRGPRAWPCGGRRRQRTADVGYALAVVRCKLSAPGHRSVDQQVEGRSRSSVVARGIWRSCSGAASASSTIWVRAGIWVHIEKICLRRSIGGPGARWPRMWDAHIAFLGADIAKVLGCWRSGRDLLCPALVLTIVLELVLHQHMRCPSPYRLAGGTLTRSCGHTRRPLPWLGDHSAFLRAAGPWCASHSPAISGRRMQRPHRNGGRPEIPVRAVTSVHAHLDGWACAREGISFAPGGRASRPIGARAGRRASSCR